MSNVRYLLKNVGILAVSQFGTKLLSFFLVPLYTSVLTTEEYGVYDLLNTTVQLLMPILTIDICNSALRYALEKDTEDKDVFSVAMKYVTIGTLMMSAIVVVNGLFGFNAMLEQYGVYLILMFLASALCNSLTFFLRGVGNVRDVGISGVLCTGVMAGLNILFLLPMEMGLDGYFLAHILGTGVQILYLFLSGKCWRYLKRTIDKTVEQRMLAYSRPLIANSIGWWVNNAADRYIVTWLCGVAVNGVYSVGYKIPSILNVFQTIFNQAWTMSAVKDFDPEDKDGFFSGLYNLYNFSMVAVCALLIAGSRILAYFLYARDFFEAWIYVPFLMISIVFGALSGYIGGIFSAVKNSKIFAQSTVIGAATNIVLNLVLVQLIGALGAAIATAVSYCVVWVVRMIHVRKYIHLRLNLVRDFVAYALLLVQTVLLLVMREETVLLYLLQTALVAGIVVLYRAEVGKVLRKFLPQRKRKD